MSRIEKRFTELRGKNEKALVCFLTAGDPDIATTVSLVLELERAGVDVIELGVPFSDPMADGPSIQASTQRALDGGTTPETVLELVRQIRLQSEVPILLMTYFNPVHHAGMTEYALEAAAAGVDGLIITDLPPDEAGDWKTAASVAGLDTVFLLAPTSTEERIALVANAASGFVYCVSRTGVTGARTDVPADLQGLISRIRSATDKPIAVGFGISEPEHVSQICKWADGAVVGSALVDLIAANRGKSDLLQKVHAYVAALKSAT